MFSMSGLVSKQTSDPNVDEGTKLGREFSHKHGTLWRRFLTDAHSFTCFFSVAGFKASN